MSTQVIRQEHEDTYFISLSDLLVGLIFIFIVLLMTYALIFQGSVEKLEQQLHQRADMRTDLLQRIQERLSAAGYESEVIADEGVLRLPEGVLFAPGQASLDARARGALSIIAQSLSEELSCFGASYNSTCPENSGPIFEAVYIEGHTDDIAIHNRQFQSNWELSSARAIATYNFLIGSSESLKDVPNASNTATLLGASAYADTRRVAKAANPTVSDRQKNRRVDFRFLLSPPSDEEVGAAAREAAQ